MAVYFVYRCGYLSPTYLYRRRFDDATVMDWFRRHWRHHLPEEESAAYVKGILGIEVPHLGGVFSQRPDRLLRRAGPRKMQDVVDAVRDTHYNAIRHQEHCLQVLTDDGKIDMAYFFFDDHFMKRHGKLAAYVLRDDWHLPDAEVAANVPARRTRRWRPAKETEPVAHGVRGEGPGRLYNSLVALYEDGKPGHLGRGMFGLRHVEGVRVATLCRYLMREEEYEWGYFFDVLSDALMQYAPVQQGEEGHFVAALRQDPEDDLTWSAYADWLQERGLRDPGHRLLEWALPYVSGSKEGRLGGRSLFQVGDHVVQLFAHARGDDYEHQYFFDDLWANAQPVLADALLRYGSRWDILSTGDEQRD